MPVRQTVIRSHAYKTSTGHVTAFNIPESKRWKVSKLLICFIKDTKFDPLNRMLVFKCIWDHIYLTSKVRTAQLFLNQILNCIDICIPSMSMLYSTFLCRFLMVRIRFNKFVWLMFQSNTGTPKSSPFEFFNFIKFFLNFCE